MTETSIRLPTAEATQAVKDALRRVPRSRTMALGLSLGAMISALATYGAISQGDTPFTTNPTLAYSMLGFNILLLLALISLVGRRTYELWRALKAGSIGSRLQTRIIVMFSVVAMLPTLIVSAFSAIFFTFGVQAWFDDRVKTALEESVAVAEAYLAEHKDTLRADAIAMAGDLNRELHNPGFNPSDLNQLVDTQAALRSLAEAMLFQPGRTLARSRLTFALGFERIPTSVLERANSGEVVFLDDEADKIRALIRLPGTADTYLLIGRLVDSKAIAHTQNAAGAVYDYERLRKQISSLQAQFSIVFLMISLLLLLAAIWYGMYFTGKIMLPITQLIIASEQVRAGDYSARVNPGSSNDEIATLGRAFNRMTEELETQRQELIAAQRSAAWADVARRVAHEIKNPLTPITLAAERLRKKYAPQITTDAENFLKYTDTISKHTKDIGKMVEEFVNFARMPAPVFKNEDILAVTRKIVFSEQVAHPDISYHLPTDAINFLVSCDERLISQMLTNILKNAAEAMEVTDNKLENKKKISISITRNGSNCVLSIQDNGPGIPADMLPRIMEPYVTTRSKGTGLGLAIVKKTMEDHRGSVTIANHPNGGTLVTLTFTSVVDIVQNPAYSV